MKKLRSLFAILLLLCLFSTAWAEGGVKVEVIRMDGTSMVVLTPASTMLRARSVARNAMEGKSDFVLPEFLTLIEENAFASIAAESVEVSENVVAIEGRAFADCKNLREIAIPATVLKIDDRAFDGCESVTVYGTKGSEAERIATLCGFSFIDPNAESEMPEDPVSSEGAPVVLPFVPAEG